MDGSLMELSGKSVRFGFRTVQLVQEPIQGSEGESFYSKISALRTKVLDLAKLMYKILFQNL